MTHTLTKRYEAFFNTSSLVNVNLRWYKKHFEEIACLNLECKLCATFARDNFPPSFLFVNTPLSSCAPCIISFFPLCIPPRHARGISLLCKTFARNVKIMTRQWPGTRNLCRRLSFSAITRWMRAHQLAPFREIKLCVLQKMTSPRAVWFSAFLGRRAKLTSSSAETSNLIESCAAEKRQKSQPRGDCRENYDVDLGVERALVWTPTNKRRKVQRELICRPTP